MTKAPGFRTLFRQNLRDWRSELAAFQNTWSGTEATQIYDEFGGGWRKRTPKELPENDFEQLRADEQQLRSLAIRLSAAADVLSDRADSLGFNS